MKTEEVVEKELVIHQKERLYKEVKEVLQRQPGPEVVEELRIVKDAIKSKMRECKVRSNLLPLLLLSSPSLSSHKTHPHSIFTFTLTPRSPTMLILKQLYRP